VTSFLDEGATGVFGKTKQEHERKARQKAVKREHDELLVRGCGRSVGQNSHAA
jgi:hypothetical protein